MPVDSLRVLLIEDNPGDARLIEEYLKEPGPIRFTLEKSSSLADGLKFLDRGTADVVLLDLSLPDSEGVETVSKIAKKASEVSIVVLTGLDDETVALQSLKMGAQDYVIKSDLNTRTLSRVIRYAVERKRINRELNDANRRLAKLDEMKSDFVNTVSHEMRTPMTVIREGVSQILDGIHGAIPKNQREVLDLSLGSIDRLARLINDVLDISKIEADKIELRKTECDLVELAKEVAKFFASEVQKKRLQIKENFPEGPPVVVQADRDRVYQVFTNLVGNAAKFTRKGHVEIGVRRAGDSAECFVADTGIGISEENLTRVFGKFEQFDRTPGPGEKGTGLGLAICKGIVELHGGRIKVESRVNEGTRFTFTLPGR